MEGERRCEREGGRERDQKLVERERERERERENWHHVLLIS